MKISFKTLWGVVLGYALGSLFLASARMNEPDINGVAQLVFFIGFIHWISWILNG